MSNLHERATRVVTIALIPALLALGGVAAWQLQVLPVMPSASTATITLEAPRASDDTLTVPRPAVEQLVEPLSTQPEPATVESQGKVLPPPRAAETPKPKERRCDEYAMYGSGKEKVWICEWQ